MPHLHLTFNLERGDESHAGCEEVIRPLKETGQSEGDRQQNTAHPGIGPVQASADDKQADSPRAENLRPESAGAEARAEAQSPPQGSLLPFTQYLRNINDLYGCADSRRTSELAKNPRMPQFSGREEGDNPPGPQFSGHPLRHPKTGAQVGCWAPDYGGLHVKYNVVCLAVPKYRGFVLCLGLRRTGRRKHRYKRIGLAFWNANAWDDCNGLGVKECIIV